MFKSFEKFQEKCLEYNSFQAIQAVQSTSKSLLVLVRAPRIFKIIRRSPVVESVFHKVPGKISAFNNSFEESITCIGMFRKVAVLEFPRSFL